MAGVLPIPNPGDIAGAVGHALEGDKVSLLALIHEAGFSGNTKEGDPADRALLAIIARESGGDPDVVNRQPCSPQGDHAVGLTQICCPMHMPVADAKNPRKNLAKAHDLYVAAGNSFARDWPTYHQGDWRTAKDKVITVSGGIQNPIDAITGAATGAVDKALGPLDEIGSAILSPDTWFRVGKGLLGAWFVILGTGIVVYVAARPLVKSAAKGVKTGNLAVNTAQKAAKLAP